MSCELSYAITTTTRKSWAPESCAPMFMRGCKSPTLRPHSKCLPCPRNCDFKAHGNRIARGSVPRIINISQVERSGRQENLVLSTKSECRWSMEGHSISKNRFPSMVWCRSDGLLTDDKTFPKGISKIKAVCISQDRYKHSNGKVLNPAILEESQQGRLCTTET